MTLPAHRLPLFMLLLVALLFMLGRGVMDGYAVFLLPISEELGLNRTSLSSVYSVTFMMIGFSGPIVGQLFDRLGAAVVYGTGVSLIAIGLVLAGEAQALWQLFLGIGICVGFGVACLSNVVAAGILRFC